MKKQFISAQLHVLQMNPVDIVRTSASASIERGEDVTDTRDDAAAPDRLVNQVINKPNTLPH